MEMLESIGYYKAFVAKRLKPSRYKHSVAVMDECVKLGERYKVDTERLAVAGLLHDIGKPLNKAELLLFLENHRLVVDDYTRNNIAIAHGRVGAIIAKEELGLKDVEMLSSIEHHTAGHGDMSIFEKIVYIADYIEPNRDFEGVDLIRAMAYKDINQSIIMAVESTKLFLKDQGIDMHPMTFEMMDNMS